MIYHPQGGALMCKPQTPSPLLQWRGCSRGRWALTNVDLSFLWVWNIDRHEWRSLWLLVSKCNVDFSKTINPFWAVTDREDVNLCIRQWNSQNLRKENPLGMREKGVWASDTAWHFDLGTSFIGQLKAMGGCERHRSQSKDTEYQHLCRPFSPYLSRSQKEAWRRISPVAGLEWGPGYT